MRPVPLIHQPLPSLAPSPWLPLALQPPGASSLSLSLPWMGPPAGPLPPRTQPYGAHPPRRVTGWSRGSAHSSPRGGHPGRGFSPGRKGLGPGTHRALHTHRGTALSPWKPSAWHLPLRPPFRPAMGGEPRRRQELKSVPHLHKPIPEAPPVTPRACADMAWRSGGQATGEGCAGSRDDLSGGDMEGCRPGGGVGCRFPVGTATEQVLRQEQAHGAQAAAPERPPQGGV